MKRFLSFLKSIPWNTFITVLIIFFLILIVAVIIFGGFTLNVGSLKLSVHRLRNPFRFFLLFVFIKLWMQSKKTREDLKRKTENVLGSKYGLLAALIFCFAVFIWIKISQHYTFRTGTYDLSMFDSALSNTLKGNFMYTSWLGRNFFSEHFSPILLLILPFYLIYDSPITLLIFQAVAVILSIIPLYKLAKESISEPLVPAAIVLAYLNYRYLLNGFMFDFHMEIFEPACIFAAFLCLRKNFLVRYFVFLLLALACKEDVAIYMFVLGGYACLIEKRWKLGIPTMFISVIWALIALKIVIPLSFPDGVQPSRFLVRWSQYGETYTQIAWNLLTHPGELFGKLLFKNLWKLLLPLGFAPLASPVTFFLSLPPILLNVTSNYVMQIKFQAHYALSVIPFLFISLIFGIKNICEKFPEKRQIVLTIFCVYILVVNVNVDPLIRSFRISKHDLTGHAIIKTIPDEVTISAQTNLIPHLPDSHQVSMLPNNLDSDYIFFDTQRSKWPMSGDEYQAILQSFIDNKNYTLSFNKEGFYLFRKKTD